MEKIRNSVIADALFSGMAEWFFVDPKYPGLLAVVDLLDPDPHRATLRAAIVNGDNVRVPEIGKTIDGSRLTPAYAIGLGTHPAVEDGLRILKAAWTTHPDSFALVLTISSHLYHGDDKVTIEAVGWGRTAVALRPNNALSHYYLALALSPSWPGRQEATLLEALAASDPARSTVCKSLWATCIDCFEKTITPKPWPPPTRLSNLTTKTSSAMLSFSRS